MRNTIYILLLISISHPVTAFVTVGSDPACDYDNLFPAYNDNDPEIRVTSQQVHTNNFTIDKIKVFKGGYDNCADAQADLVGDSLSRWTGLNANNRTVVVIDANLIIPVTVIMENFAIYDGNNTTFTGAGGINVSGNSHLILRNSTVYDNLGNEGGGLHVHGADAQISLENSTIRNNQATGFGGGIVCTDQAKLNLDAGSAIHNNTATFNGGGVFAHQNCQITNLSGGYDSNLNPRGVFGNEASQGGGFYLQGGADLTIQGDAQQAARITTNRANHLNEPGGGGLFATGPGTTITATNTVIESNFAHLHGGGLVLTDAASLIMHQHPAGCLYSQDNRCSSLFANYNNTLNGEGAAGYLDESAIALISQSLIGNNQSQLVAAFVINNGAYLRLEGNLISGNTGLTQSFSDTLFKLSGDNNQGSKLDFLYNTVVDNAPNSLFTLDGLLSSQTLNVFNSIIWDQGNIHSNNGAANLVQTDCSVVHENQSLVGNLGALLTNDPLFVNSNNDNYRLSQQSDAIDFCDESLLLSQYKDLDSHTRGVDVDTVNNAFGTYDAGAYEYIGEVIFANGFD